MVSRDKVIEALKEKPLKEYPLLMRVDPSGSVDRLRDELLKMREAGLVKFDIRKGLWSLPQRPT